MEARIAGRPPLMGGQLSRLWADDTLRATVLLTANNLVTGLGGIAFWLLAARRYAPGVVGAATASTAIMIFLAGVSQLGLGIGLVRYGRALGPRRRLRLAAIFATVALVALGVGSAYLWLTAGGARGGDGLLFLGSCVAWTLSVQYDNYLMSERRAALLVGKSLVISLLRIGLALLWGTDQPAALVAMTGASGLAGVVVAAGLMSAVGGPRPAAEPTVSLGGLVRFSLWNYLGGLAGTMPALLLPSIVVARVGAAPAAASYMAWTLFGVLLFVPSALGWALLSGDGGQGGGAPRPGRWVGRLMAGAPALFVPAAWLGLALLGPAYARDGGVVLLVLSTGYWAYYRVQARTAELRVWGSQWRLTLATTASHLAIVAASVPLLSVVGVAGGALAWSLGQWLLVGLLSAQGPARAAERQAA